MERRHKLVVVDVAVAVPVEYVRHGAHLQTAGGEFCGGGGLKVRILPTASRCPVLGLPETLTGGQNTLDELLPGHLSVLVLVDTAEEVHDARLLVVHPAHVTLPPHVEVEVGELLQLWITINVNTDVLKGPQGPQP